jgi:hypothetical protein
MNTHFLRILALAAFAVSVGQAQGPQLQADVPFQFVVGHKTLPAGTYLVDPSVSSKVLSIQSADRREKWMALATYAVAKDYQRESKLVFHRYGDRYFLAGVRTLGTNWGWEIPPTSQERELRAKGTFQRNQTTIALR